MKTYPDFSKKMYRLESEGMYIQCETLAELVSQSAKETTSPRGVEPKLHIEECENGFELRLWQYGGGDRFIQSYATEEDARQAWMQLTYDADWVDSEESMEWFDTKEEAIRDYVYLVQENDESITYDSVAAAIAESDKENAEDVEYYRQRTITRCRKGIEEYENSGAIRKEWRKAIDIVRFSGHNGHNFAEMGKRPIIVTFPKELIKECDDLIKKINS